MPAKRCRKPCAEFGLGWQNGGRGIVRTPSTTRLLHDMCIIYHGVVVCFIIRILLRSTSIQLRVFVIIWHVHHLSW